MTQESKPPPPAAPVISIDPPQSPTLAPTPEQSFRRRVLVTVITALAAILLAALIIYRADVLTLLFASVLMAVCLSAPADLLVAKTRMPRGLALGVVLLTLFAFFSIFSFSLGSTIYTQVRQLKTSLPLAIDALEQDVKRSPWLQKLYVKPTPAEAPAMETATASTASTAPAEPEEDPGAALAALIARGQSLGEELLTSERFYQSAGGALSATAGVIGSGVLIFAIGLFLAMSPAMYINGFVALFPIPKRDRVRQIIRGVGGSLQWWFLGQICSMTAVGILICIGLMILGVPAALTLGILAGLLTFIPNFGPVIAAIPAVLLALAPHGHQTDINGKLALYVIALYAIVQFAEGWLITPMIQKRAVHLPPAMIMLAQVTLLLLLGGLGLLLATPILAAILVIVRMTYVEDVLGDHSTPIKAGPLEARHK